MNFKVTLEVPFIVRNVGEKRDAKKIAIAEARKKIGEKKLPFITIQTGASLCPVCANPFESSFLVADTALVGLFISIKIFDVKYEKHADMVAKKMLGQIFKNTTFKTYEVKEIP
jgi:uncharacterized protein (UPF0212 family)